MRRLILLTALLALFTPGRALASELVTMTVPSHFVDPATIGLNNSDRKDVLQVNVLLPDGFDRSQRYPVLYLLHGAGESHRSWSLPEKGDVRKTLAGFPGIVVMPDAGTGFYTDWWNGGHRGAPAWESYFLDELIPFVEEHFPIRAGRRWHAVAGFSMGGFGTAYLASQRPGYFGAAAPFSGFLSPQRPEIPPVFQAVAGADYEDLYGPVDGFWASGHNPVKLAPNLADTRLMVRTGDGLAAPGVPGSTPALTAGGLVEADLKMHADEFVRALTAAGADVTYRVHAGVHDWPYWRDDLRATVAWGLFRPVPEAPSRWRYLTVADHGQAWDVAFRLARRPDAVLELSRSPAGMSANGAGEIELCASDGSGLRTTMPFTNKPLGRSVTVAIPAQARSRVIRSGRLRVQLRASQAESVTVRIAHGGSRIGARAIDLSPGSRRLSVPIGRRGRALLRRRPATLRALAEYGSCGRNDTASRRFRP